MSSARPVHGYPPGPAGRTLRPETRGTRRPELDASLPRRSVWLPPSDDTDPGILAARPLLEPERAAEPWSSHVPVQAPASDPDDEATFPLPVILPGTPAPPGPRSPSQPGVPAASWPPVPTSGLDRPARPSALDAPARTAGASALDVPAPPRAGLDVPAWPSALPPLDGSPELPDRSPSPLDRPARPDVTARLDTRDSQFGSPTSLPGATMLPRPGPVETPRGPFEPARPVSSVTGSVVPPPVEPRPMPPEAAAKLDQIKDLYLTAEAIGEDNLAKHFDQISQRQRELIREFFDKSGSDSS